MEISTNLKRRRDSGELSNLSVNAADVQETHFTWPVDYRVLENDYVVLSAYDSHGSVEVSLLIGRSLNANVNLVLADDVGRQVVADVAVQSFVFRVVAVYAPNIAVKNVFVLAPFLDEPKRLVLTGGWNAILDSQDRQGRKESWRGQEGVKATWPIWRALSRWGHE